MSGARELTLQTQPVRRSPGDADLADILALLHRAFASMEGRIDPPSSLHRLTVESIAEASRTGEVWTIGAPPVACVFFTVKRDSLYLGKLGVEPACQGQGLARQMVQLAEARARRHGLAILELQTRIELVENHATFARLGFRKTAEGRHAGYARPTEITMRKEI